MLCIRQKQIMVSSQKKYTFDFDIGISWPLLDWMSYQKKRAMVKAPVSKDN